MLGLNLIELLWEITPKCDKHCAYCGSKDLTCKEPLDDKDLLIICDKIIAYPPKKVTLTGGEPGSLPSAILNKIVKKLLGAKIEVAIVTNGKAYQSLDKKLHDKITFGHSINTKADVEALFTDDSPCTLTDTMITNFGTHNIWIFDKSHEISARYKFWQIQLTMGEYQLPAEGIKQLYDLIEKANDNHIVLSDNLQKCHECTAGLHSCSITYDGLVVPCLSKRSWGGIISDDIQLRMLGNISLKTIWEDSFKQRRFNPEKCKCCRDFIDYPPITPETDLSKSPYRDWGKTRTLPRPTLSNTNIVAVYGVVSPSIVIAYGAFTEPEPQTYLYGVYTTCLNDDIKRELNK